MSAAPKKKVVRVDHTPSSSGSPHDGAGSAPAWAPEPESKARATRLRLFAWLLWVVAIGLEAFAIFFLLQQETINMWLLIGAIVVTGVLSVGGSLLWKQANRLDPASRQQKLRFFVQNQLGAIVAVVAFLPLIVLIFLNKNMDGKQKVLAGGIGIVVLIVAGLFGASFDPPSQEQYAEESNIVEQLTGTNEVFWTQSGRVFHVCAGVPDVNRESKDNQIYSGTVAAAHEAGKDRLTKRWRSEATNYCGYTDAEVQAAEAAADPTGSTPAQSEPESTQPEPEDTQQGSEETPDGE